MTQETTPVMSHRGLGVKPRDNRRRDGGTRQEFDLIIEARDGSQYAARLLPETGGWGCIASIDCDRREGRGLTVANAFNDATGGLLRNVRGSWTATITDMDGETYEGCDSTPSHAIDAAYSEFTRARGLSRTGGL